MIELIEEQTGGPYVGLRVKGKVTSEDMDKVTSEIEQRIEGQDFVRLYVEVDGLDGIEAEALWKDVKFSLSNMTAFDRVALVTSKTWIDWWRTLAQPFVKADIETFEPGKEKDAVMWLRAGGPDYPEPEIP